MEYFELFELPIGFTIDQKYLNRKYIQLQKQFHPDFFGQASDEEKALAVEKSSIINKAYKTLSNRDLTLQYFLQEKKLIHEGELYKLPEDFLMEVMELNEMKMDGIPVEEIKTKALEIMNVISLEIQEIRDSYREELAKEADLLQLKDFFYKKKYLDRLLAE